MSMTKALRILWTNWTPWNRRLKMKQSNHIPTRMCIVCMQMKSKKDLIRLTKNNQGEIVIDHNYKMGGRGVWIDKTPDCVALLKKRKCLERKFKCVIPEELYEEINKLING